MQAAGDLAIIFIQANLPKKTLQTELLLLSNLYWNKKKKKFPYHQTWKQAG